MDHSLLKYETAATSRALPSRAYSRAETVADVHDLVDLAVGGVDITCEPRAGALSGFGRPLDVVIVRRVSPAPGDKLERVTGGVWTITVADSAKSIAAAVRALLRGKSTAKGLHLDLTVIAPGDRSAVMQRAFEGITRILNKRAGRLLDVVEIADIFGWVSLLTPSAVEVQVRYGTEPHWGAFMRGTPPSTPGGWVCPNTGPNFLRTLVCAVPPSLSDLTAVADIGRPFGVVNATALRARAPWAGGFAPAVGVAIPPFGIVGSAEFVADADALAAPGDVESRCAATWADLRALSAAMYVDTEMVVPTGLQHVWIDQAQGGPAYAIRVAPSPYVADFARHALDAGYKAAKTAELPAPVAAVTSVVSSIGDSIALNPSLIGHAAGGIAAVDANAVVNGWDGFVGMVLTP